MNYTAAKAEKSRLEGAVSETTRMLRSYPAGVSGLTPDAVKITPEWRCDKLAFDRAFAALRRFNADFVKRFKREYAADRRATRK